MSDRFINSFYDIDYQNAIGQGGFSKVYLARRRSDGRECAVKIIDRNRIGEHISCVYLEITLLKKLDHPIIVPLIDLFEDDQWIYLVLELMPGGTLLKRINTEWPQGYPEGLAIGLIKRLLTVVDYLHSQGIVHRDLKPENLLFDVDGLLRLSDFGLARMVDHSSDLNNCGTPEYVAPEVLQGSWSQYSTLTDMWSIGVITYVVLSGTWPFHADCFDSLIKKICLGEYLMEGEIWDSVSQTAKDFITALLVVDPKQRPSTTEALNHSWFRLE
jgi:calcium/calmodulin-dependent protein kinase I